MSMESIAEQVRADIAKLQQNTEIAGEHRRGGDQIGEAGRSADGETEAHNVGGSKKKDCDRSAITVEKN